MSLPQIITGCSGHYNKQWKGLFYPEDMPTGEWFSYYCRHFSTYEINATFYRPPTARTMQTWYKKAPEDFTYAVKAPKAITHIKKFENCEEEIRRLYDACHTGLAEKLGCILFQFPPSFTYTEEKLELIIASINTEFNNVTEFRHLSWWQPEVIAALTKAGITLCTVNYPNLPGAVVATTPVVYVRLHGNPKLFYSEYTAQELEGLYKDIIAQQNVTKAFVYFNNTASTAGILNAQQFKNLNLR